VPPTTYGDANAEQVVAAGQPVLAGGAQARAHLDAPDANPVQVKPGAHGAVFQVRDARNQLRGRCLLATRAHRNMTSCEDRTC
jgi:hypothetical protein